jgi:hypothetical protein
MRHLSAKVALPDEQRDVAHRRLLEPAQVLGSRPARRAGMVVHRLGTRLEERACSRVV